MKYVTFLDSLCTLAGILVPSSIGLELVVLALSVEVISSGLCRSLGRPITLAGCNEFLCVLGRKVLQCIPCM